MPTDGATPSVLAQVRRLQEFAKNSGAPLQIEEISETGAVAVASDAQIFEDGALVANRFQIVRRLGRGGMGEVYEAFDQINRAKVAVKVLRDDIALSAQTTERLIRREFLLSQRIAHPNICRVNDLYIHQTETCSFFIVSMEFIPGRTLAEVFAERGALPLAEVHAIARQIIAGVESAHALNIVHRDLKPSNVMIVENDNARRVIITDFGLARSDRDTASSLTNFRGFAGTLRYMAPEQIQGESAATSDIYSVGLILYEILTGGFPFSGRTGMAVGLNRLATQPRDPAHFLPAIPLHWRLALLKALEREPKNRFQTIHDFAAALDSHQAPAALKLRWAGRQFRTHAKLAIAVFALLCAILGTGLWSTFRPAPPPAFTNLFFAGLTHANSADPVMSSAELSLLSSLRQSPHLSVRTTSDTSATFQRMGRTNLTQLTLPDFREAALRTGQKALLLGNISNHGGYRLHLELQSVTGSPSDAGKSFNRDFDAAGSKDMFRAIADAAEWVRKLSGESPREFFEQNVQPADLTTGSWRALHLYQEARLRSGTNDRTSAITFLDEALSLDPGFAAAESLRGDIFAQMYKYREALQAHQRALALIKARNITGRERFQIETAYDEDTGNDAALEGAYQAWIAHFPNDYLPKFYLSGVYWDEGNFQRAIHLLEDAQKDQPSNYVLYPHLASIYLALEQPAKALQCATTLRALGESDWAIHVEGSVFYAQKRFAEAAARYRTLAEKSNSWKRLGTLSLASALASDGKLLEAESALTQLTSLDDANQETAYKAEQTLAIAYLHWLRHDSGGVKMLLPPILANLDNPDTLSQAGSLLARSGDLKQARRALQLLDRWPEVTAKIEARDRLKAEIDMANNHVAASRVLAWLQTKPKSPVSWDMSLYAARLAHQPEEVARISHEITQKPGLLFRWGRWGEFIGVPGLYWLASCNEQKPVPNSSWCEN